MKEKSFDRRPKEDMLDRRHIEDIWKLKGINEELTGLETLLEAEFSGMNPGMKKKVLEKILSMIKGFHSLEDEAHGLFNSAMEHMDKREFIKANASFIKSAELRAEIGDEEGLALALEMEARCYMNYENLAVPYVIQQVAEDARKIYEKLGDQEGIARVEKLIQEIEEKEKEETK